MKIIKSIFKSVNIVKCLFVVTMMVVLVDLYVMIRNANKPDFHCCYCSFLDLGSLYGV